MQLTDFINPISGLTYYVCMLDYGGKIGMGASVAPEYTRREVVSEVADHITSGRKIIHVKFVDGNDMTDVTDEIVSEAIQSNADLLQAAE